MRYSALIYFIDLMNCISFIKYWFSLEIPESMLYICMEWYALKRIRVYNEWNIIQ